MEKRIPIFRKAVPDAPPAPPANASQKVQPTERAAPPLVWMRELAATNIELLMDLYVQGWSFQRMATMLEEKFPDLAISPSRLRNAVLENARGRELYSAAMVDRSHMLVESALDDAYNAAKTGDSGGFKTAATIKMQVAAKLNAADYGEKSSVTLKGTGKDGAIKHENVESVPDSILEAIAAGRIKTADESQVKH